MLTCTLDFTISLARKICTRFSLLSTVLTVPILLTLPLTLALPDHTPVVVLSRVRTAQLMAEASVKLLLVSHAHLTKSRTGLKGSGLRGPVLIFLPLVLLITYLPRFIKRKTEVLCHFSSGTNVPTT